MNDKKNEEKWVDKDCRHDIERLDLNGGIGDGVSCVISAQYEQCRASAPLGPCTILRTPKINKLVETRTERNTVPFKPAILDTSLLNKMDKISTTHSPQRKLKPFSLRF